MHHRLGPRRGALHRHRAQGLRRRRGRLLHRHEAAFIAGRAAAILQGA
jgi:hypothetical protein